MGNSKLSASDIYLRFLMLKTYSKEKCSFKGMDINLSELIFFLCVLNSTDNIPPFIIQIDDFYKFEYFVLH